MSELLPLASPMAAKVSFILKETKLVRLDFRIYAQTRDPWTQARLWRQSRSIEEIQLQLEKLKREKAFFLAEILESVGPQQGRWATNNLPGQSWHQYGEAIDLVLVSDAKRTVWASTHPGYEKLAEIAKKVGLHSGWYWRHRDVNHLQLRPDAARAYYSWAELDRMTRARYEGYDGRGKDQDSGRPHAQA